jgi:hypothetical protein
VDEIPAKKKSIALKKHGLKDEKRYEIARTPIAISLSQVDYMWNKL